jgi:signal peptide peptidase SppA
MRYPHILSAFAAEPWAMQREKLQAIVGFLAFKAHGGDYSPEEIRARIDGRTVAAIARAPGDIAVLPICGVISQRVGMMQDISGGCSTDDMGAQFSTALADDSIKAIVLEVDSPGGGTYGVRELAAQIFAARGVKPVIAQVNSVAASAAYWLATQADEMVVTPGGEVGSVGVYAVHEDMSKALEMEGITPTLIKAGDNKAELTDLFPLSDSARAALQARVDQTYHDFVIDVARGRGTTASMVTDRFGQGRMYGAAEAVDRGMADRVGTLQDTLTRLGMPMTTMRGAPGRDMRMAFAAGETPKLSTIEDHLRDGGFPNDLATAFVSLGKGALRQGDPGDEAKQPAPRPGLKALRELMADFTPPTL